MSSDTSLDLFEAKRAARLAGYTGEYKELTKRCKASVRLDKQRLVEICKNFEVEKVAW